MPHYYKISFNSDPPLVWAWLGNNLAATGWLQSPAGLPSCLPACTVSSNHSFFVNLKGVEQKKFEKWPRFRSPYSTHPKNQQLFLRPSITSTDTCPRVIIMSFGNWIAFTLYAPGFKITNDISSWITSSKEYNGPVWKTLANTNLLSWVISRYF